MNNRAVEQHVGFKAPSEHAQLEALTRINTGDLLKAFKLDRYRRIRPLLELAIWPAARHFARQVIAYDQRVGRQGLQAGAAWMLAQHIGTLQISGAEHLTSNGPLLIVANHPGLSDTLALCAAIPRTDLRIVAADRPFLRALPSTERHLIYVPDAATERLSAIRAATAHLRSGGALLTFPGGQIEPDPAVLPGAIAALAGWSESIALFVRMAPQATIVPALVSGVLSRRALRNPICRFYHDRREREWVAATLQILYAPYRSVTVRVDFGPALAGEQLAAQQESSAITRTITAAMRSLIERAAACQE